MITSKSISILIINFIFMTSVAVYADEEKTEEKQTTEHSNEHEHSDKGMVLDEGRKWETDAPLRKGMQSIHDVVKKAEKAFQSKTMTQKEGEALGSHGGFKYEVRN